MLNTCSIYYNYNKNTYIYISYVVLFSRVFLKTENNYNNIILQLQNIRLYITYTYFFINKS